MPTVASYPGPRSKCLGMRLTLAAPLKPRHTIKVIPYTRESRLALARNALMTSAHSFPMRLLRSLQKEKLACVCSQDLVPGLTIHQCVWIASFPGSGEESGNEAIYFINRLESLGLVSARLAYMSSLMLSQCSTQSSKVTRLSRPIPLLGRLQKEITVSFPDPIPVPYYHLGMRPRK